MEHLAKILALHARMDVLEKMRAQGKTNTEQYQQEYQEVGEQIKKLKRDIEILPRPSEIYAEGLSIANNEVVIPEIRTFTLTY